VIIAPDHTQCDTHIRQDSSGWGIGPSQKILPDNTQHWKETYIHASGRIQTSNPASERPQNHVLDRAVFWIGKSYIAM